MAPAVSLDDVALLIETTPFDTVATVLRQRATVRPADAPYLLSIASWCSVIRDQLGQADELATLARRSLDRGSGGAAQDEPAATIVASLSMVVGAFRGTNPIDHATLDRLAHLIQHECSEHQAIIDVIEPTLEIANWFTFADRYDDAARIIDHRLEALAADDTLGRLYSLCCLAELDWRRGRWSATARRLVTAMEAAEADGQETAYAHALVARVCAAEGRWDDVERHASIARRSSQRRGDASTLWRLDALDGFIAVCSQDHDGAIRHLTPLVARNERVGLHLASVRLWDGDLIEALVRAGRPDEARVQIERLEAEVAQVPSRYAAGVIARSRALVATDAGTATTLAEEAASTFESIGAVFDEGRAELVRAEALAADGRESDAAHALRRARQIFDALDSQPWASRTATAIVTGQARPAASESSDHGRAERLAVLTPVERTVVDALLRGQSNRQIADQLHLSVKTVEAHLTRAYRKLGFSSRAEVLAGLLNA